MRRYLTFLIIISVLFCAMGAYASTNKPLKNLGNGLDNAFYGVVEIPDNMNETGSKGSPAYPDCTQMTNDDVGRGIARFVGGLWRIATFWYPEEEAPSEMPTK